MWGGTSQDLPLPGTRVPDLCSLPTGGPLGPRSGCQHMLFAGWVAPERQREVADCVPSSTPPVVERSEGQRWDTSGSAALAQGLGVRKSAPTQ